MVDLIIESASMRASTVDHSHSSYNVLKAIFGVCEYASVSEKVQYGYIFMD